MPWIAALLVLLSIQWAPFLFTRDSFYFRDLTFFFAPLISETARQWAAGVFPAWNPHLACGAPLAADPNAGALFPDILVVALLGGDLFAMKVLLLLRLVLVPLMAYAALRRISLSPPAAWIGAAMASLSGPIATSLSSFPPPLAGAIFFLPLVACGWRLPTSEVKGIAVSAVVIALTILAGSPELAVQGGIAFATCALARPLRRSVPRLAGAALVGALIAAPQWLPAAALYLRTPRGLGRVLATPPGFLSFPPGRLLELLWPGLLGDPTAPAPIAYWGRGLTQGATPYLLSIAVGLLPLVLVPAALCHPLGRRLFAVAAAFVCLSFGRHLPFGEALVRSPLFRSFRYPEKWWIGACLALAALSAIGWEEMHRDFFQRVRRPLVVGSAAFGLSLLLLAAAWGAPTSLAAAMRSAGLVEASFPNRLDDQIVRSLVREGTAGLLVALGIVLLLAMARRPPRQRLAAAMIAVLAVAERLWRVVGCVPAAPLEELQRRTPAVEATRDQLNGGRFFYDQENTTLLDPLRPFTGILYGISYAGNTDVDQFSDARSRDFADTLHALTFSDDRKPSLLRLADVHVIDTNDPEAARRRDLTSIAASESNHVLYRLNGGLPARLFFEAIKADDSTTAIRYLRARGLPTETVAIVEGHDSFRADPSPHRLSGLENRRPDTFRLEAETEGAALLQVAVAYDPNWRVSIDGRHRKAFPTDAAFLGVMIPAGRHEVTGKYREPLFAVGALAAILTLVGLLIWTRSASGPASTSSVAS